MVRCMSSLKASTVSKTWIGIDLTPMASSKVTPEPGGSGEIARPTVARKGWAGDLPRRSTSMAEPGRFGRSTQTGVVGRNSMSRPYSPCNVWATISFWTSP